MKAHWGYGCKGPHIRSQGTRRARVASSTLDRLYSGKVPVLIYRRLSEPQDQSGHEGVKKNPHPSDTRDRTRAVQPIARHLTA